MIEICEIWINQALNSNLDVRYFVWIYFISNFLRQRKFF